MSHQDSVLSGVETPKLMTLPNKLTTLRLVMIPFFILFLVIGGMWGNLLALLTFIGASLTDYYDGKIARERQLVSNFGKLMDPVADKVLILAAFIFFLTVDYLKFPSWAVIVIAAREFLVTGLRSAGAAQGKVIGAQFSGKLKMILQIATVIAALTAMEARDILTLTKFGKAALVESFMQKMVYAFLLITVAVTIYSAVLHLWAHREILKG